MFHPKAAFTGPIAATIGIPAGVLGFRGPRQILLERRISQNRMALDEILNRIRTLPKGAPEEVRKRLWDQYSTMSADLEHVTTGSPSPQTHVPRLEYKPSLDIANEKAEPKILIENKDILEPDAAKAPQAVRRVRKGRVRKTDTDTDTDTDILVLILRPILVNDCQP